MKAGLYLSVPKYFGKAELDSAFQETSRSETSSIIHAVISRTVQEHEQRIICGRRRQIPLVNSARAGWFVPKSGRDSYLHSPQSGFLISDWH